MVCSATVWAYLCVCLHVNFGRYISVLFISFKALRIFPSLLIGAVHSVIKHSFVFSLYTVWNCMCILIYLLHICFQLAQNAKRKESSQAPKGVGVTIDHWWLLTAPVDYISSTYAELRSTSIIRFWYASLSCEAFASFPNRSIHRIQVAVCWLCF